MKVLKNTAIVAISLATITQAQSSSTNTSALTCPQLSCDPANTKLDEKTCFALDGQGPINRIYG